MTLPRKAAEINDPSVQRALEIGRREFQRLVRRNLNLSATELAVCLEIADTFINGQSGFAWPKVATVARNLNRSRSQVSEALKTLETLGVVLRVRALVQSRGGQKERFVRVLGAPPALFEPRTKRSKSPDPASNLRKKRLKNRTEKTSENSDKFLEAEMPPESENDRKLEQEMSEKAVNIEQGNGTSVAALQQLHDTGSDSELFITASDGRRIRASQLEAYEGFLATVETFDD